MHGEHNDNSSRAAFARSLFDGIAAAPDYREMIQESRREAEEKITMYINSADIYGKCINLLTDDLMQNPDRLHNEVHKVIKRLGGMVADCNAAIAEGRNVLVKCDEAVAILDKEDTSAEDFGAQAQENDPTGRNGWPPF